MGNSTQEYLPGGPTLVDANGQRAQNYGDDVVDIRAAPRQSMTSSINSMSVFTNPASASKEQAGAYTAAILGLVGDAEPSVILRRTTDDLRAAIAGLSDEQLSTAEAPGKWSIRQVVRNLADSEIVLAWRLRMILAHEQPPLTGYDQDLWAERLGYAAADVTESLEEFAVLRRGHMRLLDQASPKELERYGVHAERGNESVAHLMRMYAGHDTLHLRQIARIRSSFGKSAPQ